MYLCHGGWVPVKDEKTNFSLINRLPDNDTRRQSFTGGHTPTSWAQSSVWTASTTYSAAAWPTTSPQGTGSPERFTAASMLQSVAEENVPGHGLR